MEQTGVAVVIPCTGLNEYVLECVRECANLDHDACRIVLLPDAPVGLPAEFGGGKVLVVPTGDRSIAAKRNAAIREVPDARYYAFIDSDAYPDRDWLKRGMQCFSRQDVWAVGGPSISPPQEPLRQKAVGNATRSILVSGNLAFSKTISPSRYCLNLHTCNLIVAGEALRRLGGFHEGLATGEDRELCHRIRKAGGKIYFDSQVVVYHHDRHLGAHFFSQRVVHGYSIYQIMRADPGWYNLALFSPPAAAAAAAGGILLGAVHDAGWITAGAITAGYGLMAMSAAVRHSSVRREIPLTFFAIVTANAGYLIGSILGLFGVQIDFKRLYRNYLDPMKGMAS